MGMTESAEIAANNAYLKDLSAADSAYTEGIGKLNNYLRAEAESGQNEAFQNAMTTIDSGTFNTAKELEDYLNGYKDRVSDTHWQELQGRLNYYKNNPEQQSADEEYEKQKTLVVSAGKAEDVGGYLSNTDEGNNFKIGGNKVELGTAAAQDAVPADKAARIADMVPFAYNGSIYIKINGTVYTVRGRGGKLDSDGYRNALAYLTGNFKTEEDLGVYGYRNADGTVSGGLLSGAKTVN